MKIIKSHNFFGRSRLKEKKYVQKHHCQTAVKLEIIENDNGITLKKNTIDFIELDSSRRQLQLYL